MLCLSEVYICADGRSGTRGALLHPCHFPLRIIIIIIMALATATSLSLNITDETCKGRIPKCDHGRLMYYLSCITSLGPRPYGDPSLEVPQKLTDHANYAALSFREIRQVVKWCQRLSPEGNPKVAELALCDEEGEFVGGDPRRANCRFLRVSADCGFVAVGERSVVASSVKGVGERLIMWYTPKWLEMYYTKPLKNVSIYHCLHCTGVGGLCACKFECDRPAKSRCDVLRPNEHAGWCDGCQDERYIVGALYRCTVCGPADFFLCRGCYFDRGVDDLTHPHEEIAKPGATPRLLPPRKSKAPEPTAPLSPPPGSPLSIKDIKDLVWGRSSRPLPSSSSPSPSLSSPAVQSSTTQSSYPSPALSSPTFSSSTPATESEVKKAKVPFAKDDMVVLKRLTKGDMNGKEAMVLSVDVAAQKVLVQVVGMEKAFKVKWANVEIVEELEDMEEELE